MIDLTKPRKAETEKDASTGEMILALMPFVMAFLALIEWGLR